MQRRGGERCNAESLHTYSEELDLKTEKEEEENLGKKGCRVVTRTLRMARGERWEMELATDVYVHTYRNSTSWTRCSEARKYWALAMGGVDGWNRGEIWCSLTNTRQWTPRFTGLNEKKRFGKNVTPGRNCSVDKWIINEDVSHALEDVYCRREDLL